LSTAEDLLDAVKLLAVDPGLGVRLRGGPSPMRDGFLATLRGGLPENAPWQKLPAGVTDDRLLGGLDLAATLAAGRPIAERGLLARANGGVVIAAMAERLDPGIAARLAAVLDTGQVSAEREGFSTREATRIGIVALDEGIDEVPPASLLDRLAMNVQTDGLAGEIPPPDFAALEAARALLPSVRVTETQVGAIVVAAAQLGVPSMRAPMLALRAARAAAALAGRTELTEDDLRMAARLVLGPRATQIPAPPEDPEEPPPPDQDPQEPEDQPDRKQEEGELAESVVEAAKANMPADLLSALTQNSSMRSRDGGDAGAKRKAPNRGRPIGTRIGVPRGGARLHLLSTLRAAAPWQKLRKAEPGRVQVRKDDFRIRRFQQNTRTTTIFVVDASGSTALNRLAEAKGAVELLLAECYVRRDRVALLSMRGQGAELLLPPTSSLARAKRSLAGLPGGGGTPLASGITAALGLAVNIAREGQTPLAVFLTDGRANIALDGKHGRPGAEADALQAAGAWRASGYAGLIVDTAPRPHPFARKIAETAAAQYLPLPQANAGTLSAAVKLATK
jgi:magnesium chelatase subunit D